MSSRHPLFALGKALRSRLAAARILQKRAAQRNSKHNRKRKGLLIKQNPLRKLRKFGLSFRDLWHIREFVDLEYRGVVTKHNKYDSISPRTVSVLLRTQLKRPNLLARSIESILYQDLIQSSISVNIIILFDAQVGFERVRNYISELMQSKKNNNNVNIILAPSQNSSRGALLNEGLRLAISDYILFLDDDDYVYPNHITTLVGALERTGCFAAYTAADIIYVENDSDSAKETVFDVVHYSLWWSYEKLCIQNTFPIQAIMFRHRTGGEVWFDPELHALEDWMFWLQLLRGQSVIGLPQRTSAYRTPQPGSEYHRLRATEHDHYVERIKGPGAPTALTAAQKEKLQRMEHRNET